MTINENEAQNAVQPQIGSSQKITPFLWFDGRIEEAVEFYTSVFKDSRVVNINRLPAETPDGRGKIMTAIIELNGLEFFLLDGGPLYKFNPSVSFFVHCKTQPEVDHFWESLIADGGAESRCGWLVDKFGLSWQVVPDALSRLLGDPDRKKAGAAMKAMLKMSKLDIAALEDAFANG